MVGAGGVVAVAVAGIAVLVGGGIVALAVEVGGTDVLVAGGGAVVGVLGSAIAAVMVDVLVD